MVRSAERIVDRGRRGREETGPALGHVEAIFEADSELAGQIETGLVGEAHARAERHRLATDEVDRLVAVEADAVAGAVRKAGQRVAGAVAPAFILGAHRIVDASRRAAELG